MKTLNQIAKENTKLMWPKERKTEFRKQCKEALKRGEHPSLLAFDGTSYSIALAEAAKYRAKEV